MSIDKGVDQEDVVHIYTMEYYSAIKKNEIPACFATWMDLETIMLSEVSHTMRHQHQILSLTCGIWKKDRLNFSAEQMLTHRHWKTYGLQRRQFGGWGCAWVMGWKSCEIELLWSLYNYRCDKFIWIIKKRIYFQIKSHPRFLRIVKGMSEPIQPSRDYFYSGNVWNLTW